MKRNALVKQTAILSGANFLVRALGFVMRIFFSRVMGAQAIGLMELSSSIHMLLITPVTAGVPTAVSRMVAQQPKRPEKQHAILHHAIKLSLNIAMPIFFVSFFLSPMIAKILGDDRTLPSLIAYLPCIPVLAVSAALNGYYYGMGITLPPALSELLEQGIRFTLTCTLLFTFQQATVAYRAAFPAVGTFAGELLGLVLMLLFAQKAIRGPKETSPAITRTIFRLAVPMTLMRLLTTLMRTVNSILIPARLMLSGLSATEATARLGMLSGMAMPLLMMPSFITGALAMVSTPAIAARQNSRRALKNIIWRVLLCALGICLICMVFIYIGADFLATTLYHQADLIPLLRFLCPLLPIIGIHQIVNAMLSGLGLQKKALQASLWGNLLTVICTFFLTSRPDFRLYGCALGMMLGHAVILLFNLITLREAISTVPA